MQIPFGKYTGLEIEEIPSSYLKWLAENCDDDEIVEEAETEYEWRERFRSHF